MFHFIKTLRTSQKEYNLYISTPRGGGQRNLMRHQHIENVYAQIDKKAFLKKAFHFPISNVKKEFFERIYHITSA